MQKISVYVVLSMFLEKRYETLANDIVLLYNIMVNSTYAR